MIKLIKRAGTYVKQYFRLNRTLHMSDYELKHYTEHFLSMDKKENKLDKK